MVFLHFAYVFIFHLAFFLLLLLFFAYWSLKSLDSYIQWRNREKRVAYLVFRFRGLFSFVDDQADIMIKNADYSLLNSLYLSRHRHSVVSRYGWWAGGSCRQAYPFFLFSFPLFCSLFVFLPSPFFFSPLSIYLFIYEEAMMVQTSL